MPACHTLVAYIHVWANRNEKKTIDEVMLKAHHIKSDNRRSTKMYMLHFTWQSWNNIVGWFSWVVQLIVNWDVKFATMTANSNKKEFYSIDFTMFFNHYLYDSNPNGHERNSEKPTKNHVVYSLVRCPSFFCCQKKKSISNKTNELY